MHIHLLALRRLATERNAHTTTPSLNNTNNTKSKRDSPSKPRNRADSRTCAGDITDLFITHVSHQTPHLKVTAYRKEDQTHHTKANPPAQKHRKSHKPTKPKQHRQALQSQQRPLHTSLLSQVRELGQGGEQEGDETEDGTGGRKDEVVYLQRGGLAPVC